MSEFAEIKGLVEKINPALVGLRADIDELKTRDPLDDERFKKQAEYVTDAMAKLQEVQAKADALAAAMDREDFGKSADERRAAESRKQANDFFRKGITLDGKERDKAQLEIRAMSTDVNPDGGFLVRPEFVGKVVGRDFETSPMREVSEVITGGAKSIELLIDDDEAVVRRIGEGASGGETDTPDIGLKVIVAHKYEAAPKVTIEMVQDADFDVEGWLGRKVSNKITRTENADFVNGTGVNAARGFLTLPAWASAGVYEREKIEQVNMGAAAALDPDGLIDVQGSLHEAYQPGASWVMHRTTYSKALQLKGADQYHFGPVLLRDGQAQTVLLNKPVRFMADMPTVAANALAVAYGDWRMGYTIYDRVGVIVLRDPYSAHGFITYYTTKRTGGDVTSYDAIKIGKVAA
jgi:HK97 family phage major capsid protein